MLRVDAIHNRRAIIDRRALADGLASGLARCENFADRRRLLADTLRGALLAGRTEIAERLEAHPGRGLEMATAQSFLTDQLLRLACDTVVASLYPLANPTQSERLALAAVGGYGRGQMAPFSDVDIVFITPWKQTPWGEQVIETLLYLLWDLGLKVGNATRSLDDVIRIARSDMTVRTAFLEARFVWGDQPLFDEANARFRKEVVAGTARAFVAEKLAEREARHQRMGDSRYVVEPNLKEGKGGLRDLHALFWIGKYLHQVHSVAELVDKGLLTADELRQFRRAESFLWSVRIMLHHIT
ncbi:MAG: bifunctional uridylyltransferase/uridylyl-removing protein, partial [Sphingomonadales bacterium 12-62-5]